MKLNKRTCAACGTEIVDVRESFSGATFPVNAKPIEAEGYELSPPEEKGQRNPVAVRTKASVYIPHTSYLCDHAQLVRTARLAPSTGTAEGTESAEDVEPSEVVNPDDSIGPGEAVEEE